MRPSVDVIWIRQDLRLHDNASLFYGAQRPTVLVFSWADFLPGRENLSTLSAHWLHAALKSFMSDLEGRYKAKLMIHKGRFLDALDLIEAQADIGRIHWNRSYAPGAAERDALYQDALAERGFAVETHAGNYLHEPWELQGKSARPIEAFSQFQRLYFEQLPARASLEAPREIQAEALKGLNYGQLKDLNLVQDKSRQNELLNAWDISEKGARDVLKAFAKDRLPHFEDSCEIPAVQATSKLSPYIRFGQASVRGIWQACAASGPSFLNQLLWREFATYTLFHNPKLVDEPYSQSFRHFPWRKDDEAFTAWCEGRTGYPIVDAGMRELRQTGWIHYRVRVLVASFLVKNLGISWERGAAFFDESLLDSDSALNTLNWQLVAGCGVDSYPFTRILNPISQGERFDPEGIYVTHWVPELRQLPEKWVHRPWAAPADLLKRCGVGLGQAYPHPLVDFDESKDRALSAFDSVLNAADKLYGTG